MFSMFNSIGWEVPLALLLLGLMGFRFSVTPRTSVLIKATCQKVFQQLDVHDGKINEYGRTIIRHDLVDAQLDIYRLTYTTTMMGGTSKSFTALFRVTERVPGQKLVFTREGLEGKPTTSELLQISHTMTEESGGTRLRTAYSWGPRPLLAQITSRTDLWGGSLRLKSLIETGIANDNPYNIIAACVAVFTGWRVACDCGSVHPRVRSPLGLSPHRPTVGTHAVSAFPWCHCPPAPAL
jgi:hypothetical protein